MKPSIYIAGPMRGYPANNFPAFFAAEDYFRELGFEVLNPARMDQEHPLTPTEDNPDPWSERDLLAVRSADFIALLEGWERSIGATCEAALAAWLRIPAYKQGTSQGGTRTVFYSWSDTPEVFRVSVAGAVRQ